MAIVPITPGIDERVILVDTTGSPIGSVGNPLNVTATGGGSGGTSAVDAVAWTTGVSSFNPGGGVFNDSAAALVSGTQGTLRMTPNRAQHVNLRNQAGAEITSFGGVSVVDAAAWTTAVSSFCPGGGVFNDSAAALTSGQQGTFRSTPNRAVHANLRSQNGTELFPVPAALADATANPTLTELANFPMVFNGTTWDRALDLTAATNGTKGVPAAGMVVFDTVDVQNKRVNSGASAIAGGVTGKNAALLAPLGYTVALGTNPVAMAAGVFAPPTFNRHSIPYAIGGHPNVITFSATYTAAQTNTAVITQAAGGKIVVTSFLITCSNANTVNVSALLGFGTATLPAQPNPGILGSHPNIAPGSGFGRGNGSAIIGAGADDEDLRITTSVATGGFVNIDVSYFVLPS